MKIAYLISAHTDPIHLARLIKALSSDDAVFFIHLDARADEKSFAALKGLPGIFWVKKRIRVLWGDITQVYYQIELLRTCLESGMEFDRICTLSGLDYPIQPDCCFRRLLTEDPEKEFIQGIDLNGQNETICNQYQTWRPQIWIKGLNEQTNLRLRKGLRLLLHGFGRRKELSVMVNGKKWHVFKGSDWWCITPKLARYMLHTIESQPEIIRYFRTAFAPSELIWQTITFNSPFAEKAMLAKGKYISLAALTPLHHIVYHPVIKIFTEKDWQELMDSGKPFCRKTITGLSDTLMDRIDRYRDLTKDSITQERTNAEEACTVHQ